MINSRLGLPQQIIPIFWGLLLLEATYGAYMGIWPLWIESLGAPVAVVGFMLGAGGFLRLFVLAPTARIAERFGYRRTIVVARMFTVIGLLAAAFASHWPQLLVMVVFAAIGEMVFPLIQTLVATEAGEDKMRSFALVFTVGPSIALAISPLLSGGLVALFGMRAAFLLGAVFTLLSLVFLRQIQEPPVVTMEEAGPPRSYRAALANPSVRLLMLLLLAVVFSLSLGIAFIPTFLEDVHGMAPARIAAMGSLAAVGSAVFGLAVARIRRLQRLPFIAVAMAVTAMALAFTIFRTTSWYPLLTLAFFLRGGFFSAWAMLLSVLGEVAPEAVRSRAFALMEMAGGIAFALGPIVAGFLYATSGTLPLEVATVLSLALVPLLLLVQRYGRRFHLAAAPLAPAMDLPLPD